MQIVDLSDEYPASFSPEMTMTVIDHDTKKDFGMACHTQPLKKVKKQGEMPYPASVPSHP